jgi:DNA-binding SARP family transcriptional activator
MVKLRALGMSEIETTVTTLTPSQDIVFAAALFLLLERGNRASRVRLASLLWPSGRAEPRAHRLRQTILQLKKSGLVVEADRAVLRIPPTSVESDIARLFAGETSVLAQVDSLEFLPGYSPRCSDAFRDWVDTKREEVHAIVARLLLRVIEEKRRQADWTSVERIAAKCLVIEPLNEAAVLAKAEACAMRGGKLQAIAQLDRYIDDIGGAPGELKLPATILRRRVVERIPERPMLPISDPPLVGRESEMEALTLGFERTRNSKGSTVVLIGDPGIGKTRLSGELARFAELQGAQVQSARCRRTDLDRPLSLFVDIVPHLREMPGALGCTPDTFTWLKRLTEFDQRAGNSTTVGETEIPFQNVREALFDLFDSVADEQRLVLIVEDVQWLDPASAKILARMTEWCETKRVFLVINSRPVSSPFLDYAEKAAVPTIVLGGLTHAASATLLRSIVPESANLLEAEFVDWCLRIADGNPFFLQELVRQWIETGHRYEAPPSVTNVLHERISRLSKEALHVLQTCAILGDCATIGRVERMLGYQPYQTLSAIEELSRAAMLGMSDKHSVESGRLQPRHDFLSSAALMVLAPPSLAFLHRRAADVLEEEIAKTAMSTTLLWACATHRNRAGDRQRALSLGISCAQHLLELGLAAEACARFEESLAYCSSVEDRLSLLPRYSVALQVNGEWERSKRVLQTCIVLSAPTVPVGSHSHFELLLFQARHRSSLDFVTLLDDIMPCVESHDASPAHRVGAAVIALKVASDVGPAAKLDAIYAAVQPFLADGEIDFVLRFEAELIYQTMRAEREVSLEDMKAFVQASRESYGEIGYSNALVAVASACRISGRDRDAIEFIKTAMEHAEGHKMRARIPAIILAEIRVHVLAEDFVSARAAISRGKLYEIPVDDQVTRPEWQFYEARVALEDRTLEEAERAASAIEIVPATNAVARRAGCLAVVLRIRLRQEATSEVIRSLVRDLETAHMITRDIGAQDFEVHSLYLGLCAVGEDAKARRLLHEYVRHLRRSRRQLATPVRQLLAANQSMRADGREGRV